MWETGIASNYLKTKTKTAFRKFYQNSPKACPQSFSDKRQMTMDKQNISVLDILEQVQNQNAQTLAGLEQIKQLDLAEIEIKENPLVGQILNDIAVENDEIARHLSEINEQLNR